MLRLSKALQMVFYALVSSSVKVTAKSRPGVKKRLLLKLIFNAVGFGEGAPSPICFLPVWRPCASQLGEGSGEYDRAGLRQPGSLRASFVRRQIVRDGHTLQAQLPSGRLRGCSFRRESSWQQRGSAAKPKRNIYISGPISLLRGEKGRAAFGTNCSPPHSGLGGSLQMDPA